MDKACEQCGGTGWVCENHTDRPWGAGPNECDCGAGRNCPCNPQGEVEWQVCLASTNADEVGKLH
jgi:hypothetical protein